MPLAVSITFNMEKSHNSCFILGVDSSFVNTDRAHNRGSKYVTMMI